MINDVIETLRPKTETVEIRLPIPGTSDVFAFEFAIIPDYVQYKRVYEDARRFGEKIISPATKQLYGDDLVEDIATAGSCHVYAKLMRSVKRISISDEGEQLVGDPGDPWSVREWMKFAKHCGPMFLMIEAQIMEKIVGAAATGEHDQVELAKKKIRSDGFFRAYLTIGRECRLGHPSKWDDADWRDARDFYALALIESEERDADN